MPDLHDALGRLAAEAQWPPTPELAAPVRAAIEAQPARRRSPRAVRGARPLALAPAAARGAARAASSAAACSPRRASARGCSSASGCSNASVTKVERLPPTGARRAGSALGERVHARRRRGSVAGFELLRPAALGAPAEVYVDDGVVDVRLPRPLRPADPVHAGAGQRRALRPEVRHRDTRRVRIGGAAGLLLRGPHAVFFDERRGEEPRMQEARLAKNTLMWERDGLLLRLEAEQPVGELCGSPSVRVRRQASPEPVGRRHQPSGRRDSGSLAATGHAVIAARGPSLRRRSVRSRAGAARTARWRGRPPCRCR